MNRTLILLSIAIVTAGCGRGVAPEKQKATAEMRTIDSSSVQPAAIEPPPMITDEAPPPKTSTNLAQADAPPPPTAQDEALRAGLPFAPAIAMDAVDGSKISIRASTPTVEYKNKLYYFSSDDHKRAFVANPEQYTKGLFSHL